MKWISKCVPSAVAFLFFATAAQAAVLHVPAGGNLQAALNQAQPGDTIVLEAGARFVGQFKFPAKAGMVTLRSSGALPERRITPGDAPLMATISSGMGAMALDLYDAKNWTIDGIRFEANTSGYGEIIGLWRAEHIVLRRLLLVVPDPQEQKRFVLGNGRHITLTQSHCSGIWRSAQDSQCFAAWDGAGPYTITDNFLEAASENVMFGGADSLSSDNIPSDILIEHNLFTKRLEWKGKPRGVKNLFELKAARRVVVRHNLFERNWIDAQAGSAIVFTPRNQDGTAPWTVIEDVLFEHNIVRDTPAHFSILGYDNNGVSAQTTRITIRHNLLLGSGGGRLATIGNEVGTLVFDHNTYVNPVVGEASMVTLFAEGGIRTTSGTRPPAYAIDQFTFTNTMTSANYYGLHSSIGFGSAALTAMTRGYTWTNNVLAGGWGTYPAVTTLLPVSEYPEQFDPDYYLVYTSPFKSMATDGTDIGWNPPAESAPPAPPPVAITTSQLPAGQVGIGYSTTLAATGGSGTFTWSMTAGALPAGLSLNSSTGAITGTPATAGTSTASIRAADAGDASNSSTATFTLVVEGAVEMVAVTISGATVPGGRVTVAYAGAINASGGTGSFRWSVSSGALPAGVMLNADTGTITGTPTSAGTTTFTIRVCDAADSTNAATATYTVAVTPPIGITTTSLPAPVRGKSYSTTLASANAIGSVTWTISSGALPSGLSLDAATGVISGTATNNASATFTITAADSNTTASRTFTMKVSNR